MMKSKEEIPIHDFIIDNNESIPFKYVPLGTLASYDFSLPHRHNYYEIFFFAKGGGRHLIDFKEYEINDNSIHFVSPGQVHLVKRALDSYGSLILFSRDFFNIGAGSDHKLFNFPFLNNSQYPLMAITEAEFAEFKVLLSQTITEQHKNDAVSSEITLSYLKVILLKCLQLFEINYPEHQRKEVPVFHLFREMIEKEYRLHHQPAYFASKLNITEKKLNEICKMQTGEKVSEYIKSRILLEAKRLLVNTEHSVKEIAHFLGFDDPAYFYRFFRGNIGCTAGEFRKKQQNML